MRLGEASGALLALPLIGQAARLHREMSRFDEAGVERAAPAAGRARPAVPRR
jgi:nicotinate-nucleotide--dimethylbenzimidazole phosphoribosyltransferase